MRWKLRAPVRLRMQAALAAAASVVTNAGGNPFALVASQPIALAGSLGVAGDVAVASAQSDWASRIAGPDVVWYHGFDSAAEVDQFRWTGGYSGGNDPLGNGEGAEFLTHVASGGPDGGGFLRSQYPAGETAGRGNSYWWRPFNPLTGATNGRGEADPGAGSLTPIAFNASDGSSTTYSWSLNASNPGWYGSAADQAAAPEDYQGGDFYLQIRVRRAQTPGPPPDSPGYSNITGKNVWLTTTASSFVAQELVTYGQSVGNGDTVGVQSPHNLYVGQNFTNLDGQPNGTVAVSNSTVDWHYSGGWDTLLYHVTPGTNGGTGADRTRVEVWAQHDPTLFPEEAGVYTKIWDATYTQGYSTGTNSVGAPLIPGWNALILGSYHNGSAFDSSFNFDYGQIIFSKATIPAPGASLSLEALSPIAMSGSLGISCNLVINDGSLSTLAALAASMSPGSWAELTTTGADAAFFQSGASGSILAYTTAGAWDEVNQRVHFVGQYHGMGALRSVMLDLATNEWTVLQSALEAGGHGYDHVECDPRNGDAYYHPFGLGTNRPVYRYTHASGTWNTSGVTLSQYRGSTNGSCTWTGALTGFSGPVNVMLECEFGNWYGVAYDTLDNGGAQDWTVLGDTPINGSLHVVCEYSAVHNCAVGGGGNNNDFDIWRLDSDLTVTQLTDCPRAFGTQRGLLNVDPVTGNFLVLASDGTFWELDPTGSGTWTQLTGSRAVPSGLFPPRGDTNSTSAGVSILGHDVVLYVSTDTSGNTRTWLFKNA